MKEYVMKKLAILSAGIAIVLVAGGALAQPDEPTREQAAPDRDQRWLKQLVGEWDTQWKMYLQPEQPPLEATGTDSVRALGGNWIIAEAESTVMDAPFSGILSLGYDAQEERFHGTWIDSYGGTMWVYKGTVNESGDTLTLETDGPSLEVPGKTTRYREVIRITGEKTRTFHSSYESEDGEWVRIVEIAFRRKPGSPQAPQDRTAPHPNAAMNVHYLEIVTPEMDAMCDVLEQSQGVTFSDPVAELGNARTARLNDGSRIGVRAPMGEEQPVVRPYVLVDDIHTAVKAAEAAGAEMMMPPTEIPGQGTFAIYRLGKIEHGFWQTP